MEKKIVLRFDDICPTMNWQQWAKAKSLLDKYGVKALLGVIPDCKDPDLMIDLPKDDFWEYIRELQKECFSIAMHGLNHIFDSQARGIVNRGFKSEFAGHPYDVQYNKIKKGKDILESKGIKTDVFFAPAHSYDDNTLKALAANGFKYISDGKSCKPYKRNGIICIPARSTGIPKIKWGGYYTAVLHAHEWVREDKKEAWPMLQELCNKHSKEIASFEEFKEWGIGFPLVQKINERCFLVWERSIKPLLKKIRKQITL